MTDDGQAEVLAFLAGGALGGRVERIDTHGAVILLAGERAWKMKRAVRFSFMDFSTLARRKATLEAELALNRRTAPELYRRVVAVTREADGRLALGGSGEPVEWLLEMARFPQDAQLDRVAARGELGPDLIEALAVEICRFHAEAEVRRDKGGYAAMRAVVEGNAGDLASLAPAVFDAAAVAALNAATQRELEARAHLLDQRRADGRVRHCHGDLHLANIVLLERGPVLFDCLEFDEELACIDVLYDLAFLVMDLIRRGLPAHARTLLQAYHDRAEDDAGLALLPLFLSVRAAIRAKVAGFNAGVLGGEARTAKVQEAGTYLALARKALEPVPPRLLVVAGRSGTGKSSVAKALAPAFGAMPGAMILRSDVIRKRLLGKEPTERLPPEAYTPEHSARVFARIADRARVLLAAGRTVIADAVYGEAAQREAIEAVAKAAGVPFRPVWLEAAEPVLEARVGARRGDASDADLAVVRAQARTMDPSAVLWPRVAAGRPLDEVAADVRRIWES
ncbi:AAA family ATPase [Benzoatithermus flavus]|uniref:AAA family ATPase n=1 Tax=Benzoatithermus flavus TaxID=3108223 RepID=A0ABU8XM34_9PROT